MEIDVDVNAVLAAQLDRPIDFFQRLLVDDRPVVLASPNPI